MKYPTTRLVYDRKNQATKEKAALVQVEVLLGRKKKYISTGVKVTKDHWSPKETIVGTLDMIALRQRISEVKGSIDAFILELMKEGKEFEWEYLENWLKTKEERNMTFLEFAEERMANRNDIKESTRKAQVQLISSLEEFGKIVTFADLTKQNILRYEEWLRGQGLKVSTIGTRMKVLHTYVNEALKMEIIKADPFLGLKFKRGEPRSDRYLTMEEYKAIRDADISSESLARVRDIFIVQCMTGLRVSDIMAADFTKAEKKGDRYVYQGKSQKTGEPFYFVLMPDAVKVLERYDWHLPKMTMQQYNLRLKVVADAAKVDKPITTHYARHTAAMFYINEGMPIEVVSKVLGHASIKTTESVYAKIINETVDKEFDKLINKRKNDVSKKSLT